MSSMPPPDALPDDLDVPPALPAGDVRTDAPCFRCGLRVANRIRFTWWGGVLGPRLLHHVECVGCGQRFNAGTGAANKRAITIYLIVSGVVAVVLVVLLVSFLREQLDARPRRR